MMVFESGFERWIRSGILRGRSSWQRLQGRKLQGTWWEACTIDQLSWTRVQTDLQLLCKSADG